MKKLFLSALFLVASCVVLVAQDDMLALLDSAEGNKNETVFATFKTSRVVNAQTIETVKAQTLDFRITHRFGNMGVASNGGGHTLYGFDVAENIRFSFDYGITNKLTVGIGRSKRFELIDGSAKYRFLEQTVNNKVPLTLAVYSVAGFSPVKEVQFYQAVDASVKHRTAHRLSYVTQLLIARKFSRYFSFELLPTYSHRNFVVANVNPNNGAIDENGLFSVGAALRLKITQRVAVVADYFYTFSQYRQNNSVTAFYAPLSLGVEIDTGGHVFHINLSNSSGITENDFIPYTTDNWLKGGFKLGFNISRVFNI